MQLIHLRSYLRLLNKVHALILVNHLKLSERLLHFHKIVEKVENYFTVNSFFLNNVNTFYEYFYSNNIFSFLRF